MFLLYLCFCVKCYIFHLLLALLLLNISVGLASLDYLLKTFKLHSLMLKASWITEGNLVTEAARAADFLVFGSNSAQFLMCFHFITFLV